VHTRMSIIQTAMIEYLQHGEYRWGWGVETAQRFLVSEATVSNLKYMALQFLQQDQESPSLTVDDLLLGMPAGNPSQQPVLSEYGFSLCLTEKEGAQTVFGRINHLLSFPLRTRDDRFTASDLWYSNLKHTPEVCFSPNGYHS